MHGTRRTILNYFLEMRATPVAYDRHMTTPYRAYIYLPYHPSFVALLPLEQKQSGMVQPSNSWDPPAQQTIPSITPQRHQGTATSSTQSQRVCFWAAAAFAWAVWALAVRVFTQGFRPFFARVVRMCCRENQFFSTLCAEPRDLLLSSPRQC